MRIGILTFQRTINYGAALQCFALWSTLRDMGHDVEVIDYRSRKIEETECLRFSASPKSLLKYLAKTKKRAGFARFSERFDLSPSCTRATISAIAKRYDVIVVGSDQVWNPPITGGDLTYFLDFETDPARCKTYAASAGLSKFGQDEPYARLLSHFSSLLLRESSLLPEVARLTARAEVEPHVVVDPTLLLDAERWRSVAKIPSEVSGKRYVLHYAVSELERSCEVARDMARERGCEVVQVTHRRAAKMHDAIQAGDVSPEEFVGLFCNAEAVVASSFHGVCFSLIFEREFVCTLKDESRSSRVIDLLAALDLGSRVVSSGDEAGKLEPIDYALVAPRIVDMREESLRLLAESLCGERE